MFVGHDLHFDVAALLDVFFDQECVVAEGARGFAPRRGNGPGKFVGGTHDPHSLAASTSRGFDDDRIRPRRHVRGVEPRRDGDSDFLGDLACPVLAAHDIHDVGGRADEDEPRFTHAAGELRALGQEPVAGVDRFGPTSLGGVEDLVDVEIGLQGRRWADVQCDIGLLHMQCVAVGIGVDGDAADFGLAAGADDAARDFAPIRDEDAGKLWHRSHILKMPKCGSGTGALAAAASPMPSTRRVSRGSMMPSSHSLAVE